MADTNITQGTAPPRRRGRLRRALRFAFPYRKNVFIILLITLVLAAINAAEPLVFKYVFDPLHSTTPSRVLLNGVLILLGLGIFREAATASSNWLTWHTRLGMHYALLETTVERIHRMPLSLHRSEGVGAIIQILFNVFPRFFIWPSRSLSCSSSIGNLRSWFCASCPCLP